MSDFQKFLDQALKTVDINQYNEEQDHIDYDVFDEIRLQLITARNESGLTQKELAEKAGLTQANVSKIEKGISHPTIDTLLKLAKALNKRLTIRLDEFERGDFYD